MYQCVSNCVEICQSVSKCVKVCERVCVSKCAKVCQTVSKCVEMYKTCYKIHQNVSKYVKNT